MASLQPNDVESNQLVGVFYNDLAVALQYTDPERANRYARDHLALIPGLLQKFPGSDDIADEAAVAHATMSALLHRRRTETRKTLVILDEVHHGGDALSWGDAVREAFEPAARRLALTGTPFRSDTSAIPFVTYERGRDGVRRSAADYSYGYGRALADGVVRPVMFLSYSGQMRWRTRACCLTQAWWRRRRPPTTAWPPPSTGCCGWTLR